MSEQWRELVAGWLRSGLTQQVYCERHGVAPGSVPRWAEVFRQESVGGQGQAADAVSWVDASPVVVTLLILVLPEGCAWKSPGLRCRHPPAGVDRVAGGCMIAFDTRIQVYLALGPTDMRKSA